ncbi:3beta-hydroxysteroid-dehydrogenase/decarboxylase isoform 1 [Gracilariopsis chorda]|uniref:3beta-hydroxysteroid-dehydrogenase/decarboxylase isoform 1 n=1 Tax=Gracilariopsis chorda TaxID=448386 RepID=A0A2V3J1J8_9FLOR|nr:3beta-hydroxysteroid-dehydrogenase/decarboxylase isoform 1 [Gracilariopsis chorda]|eukprot:PXF48193.1 3beta-hydroxysteroid-dehydrogenase/decarboxylase isoform 1 [Gracilariopsis chorda]
MRRCLVTGGSGFLGRHLIDGLLSKKDPDVQIAVFDIRPYEHHVTAQGENIECFTGTITKLGDVLQACRDIDVVFHCATANPLDNHNEALMWSVNIEGTKNIIEACKQCNVSKLVYVSSASVVYDGSPMLNVDETQPYPSRFTDFYSMTKAKAEQAVLEANRNTLATCSLRPSSIFGERDPAYVPSLIESGKKGKTKYMIGNGKTKWEFTYVGNVVDACLRAADNLEPGSPIAGNAYFITNDETFLFWEHASIILEGLGYPKPSVRLPMALCFVLAAILEFFLLLLSPFYKPKKPPVFTRQKVKLLTTDRVISCEKAKRDLGYKPSVSMQEGTMRTIDYFRNYDSSAKPSKKE